MFKKYIRTFAIYTGVLCSFSMCNAQDANIQNCKTKLNQIHSLLDQTPDVRRAFQRDSVLGLISKAWSCDSIRPALAELKIRLLISEKKFYEALHFTDSLSANDFGYGYKKQLFRQNIQAMIFRVDSNFVNEKFTYQAIVRYLTEYINSRTLDKREFEEVFTELFTIERNILNQGELNNQIDSLIKRYPDKSSFFEFFRTE